MTLNAATDPSLPSLRDRHAINEERLSTVALLHDVANDPRFAPRRHELRILAAAVKSGGSREGVWRGVNLQQTFAPESTIRLPPKRRRRMAGVLGALAVVLVLIPVCWMLWSFGQAAEPVRSWLPGVVQGFAPFILWSILFALGSRLLSRSAQRTDKNDRDQAAAQLAQALNCASITINSRDLRDPIQGVDLLTEAAAELLRAQQAAGQSLHTLQRAAHRLGDSTSALADGAGTIGTSLVQHTGALQHQISELTQVRASLERLSGLASFEDALAGRTPQPS